MRFFWLLFLIVTITAESAFAQSAPADQSTEGDCSPNVIDGNANVDCSTNNYNAAPPSILQLWRGLTGNVASIGGCMMKGEKAEKQLRHALTLNSSNPITWLCLGATLIENGKPEISFQPLQQAALLAKHQQSWDIEANAMRLQSSAYLSTGQHSKALQAADEALKIYTLVAEASKMAETNNLLGVIAREDKQCVKSQEHFSVAVRLAEIEKHPQTETFKANLEDVENCT